MLGEPHWRSFLLEEPRTVALLSACILGALAILRVLWAVGVPGWLLAMLLTVAVIPLTSRASLRRALWLLVISACFAFLALAAAATTQDALVVLSVEPSLPFKNVLAISAAYACAVSALVCVARRIAHASARSAL